LGWSLPAWLARKEPPTGTGGGAVFWNITAGSQPYPPPADPPDRPSPRVPWDLAESQRIAGKCPPKAEAAAAAEEAAAEEEAVAAAAAAAAAVAAAREAEGELRGGACRPRRWRGGVWHRAARR
jgi:hypothetical protein